MASIKNSFTALLAVSLLALSSADVNLATCDPASASGNGNERTTYDILCDGGFTDDSIATFDTLCHLIRDNLTKPDGTKVDVKAFLSKTDVTTDTEHTIFAPTDAAFDATFEGNAILFFDSLEESEESIFKVVVANLLEQFILQGAKLTSDFICDDTYETINLVDDVDVDAINRPDLYYGSKGSKAGYYNGANRNDRKLQKTKCRGQADTFRQIGPGNVNQADQPTVGRPGGIFDGSLFISDLENNNGGNSLPSNRSNDIIGCNGVIQVVNGVILTEQLILKGGKGFKSSKNRALREDFPSEEIDPEANRENRRARLESLLVDANGNIDPLN